MSLILPEHVAQKIAKDEAAKAAQSSDLEKAYVEPKDRVLDPGLLDKSLLDRLPQPTGWRILVMPYQGKATTKGGVHMPDEVVERESVATTVAYVLKVGPTAYDDKEKYGKPWCEEGQWVCIGRYSGSRFKIDGGEVRIINDDEVIATIADPDDIKQV